MENKMQKFSVDSATCYTLDDTGVNDVWFTVLQRHSDHEVRTTLAKDIARRLNAFDDMLKALEEARQMLASVTSPSLTCVNIDAALKAAKED